MGDAEFGQMAFDSEWITPQIVMRADEQGYTALFWAISRGEISVVQAFVDGIAQFDERERCEILNNADPLFQKTVLRCAAVESLSVFRIVYDAYPETEKLTALKMEDWKGDTALRY